MSRKFHPDYARTIAKAICYDLIKTGAVERIKIVGGLRRGDQEVRGASVLYISRIKLEYQKGSQKLLFETEKETRPPKVVYLAETAIEELAWLLDYRKDESGKLISSTGSPLLMRAMISKKTEVPIDLYPTELYKWGVTMIEKTGPAAFVEKVKQAADQRGYRILYGKVESKSTLETIKTPSEIDVFHLCGMQWTEPKERK